MFFNGPAFGVYLMSSGLDFFIVPLSLSLSISSFQSYPSSVLSSVTLGKFLMCEDSGTQRGSECLSQDADLGISDFRITL